MKLGQSPFIIILLLPILVFPFDQHKHKAPDQLIRSNKKLNTSSRKIQGGGLAYAVMIDAGSSGSRVHIYTYEAPADSRTYATVRLPERKLKIKQGLSSHAANVHAAGASLLPLLGFAKQQVPHRLWSVTPVHLMATAGLRLQSRNISEAILKSCREVLSASGFLFKQQHARVLSGTAEGLFAWAAVNYATGKLQDIAKAERQAYLQRLSQKSLSYRESTWGVLELGGGSLQLTVMPKERLPPKASSILQLPGVIDKPIYTHSWLGFGLDAALAKLAKTQHQALKLHSKGVRSTNPCFPVGHIGPSGQQGGGNFALCRNLTRQLLSIGRSHCRHKKGSNLQCGLFGEFMPRISGLQILAIENFFFTLDRLGLPSNASLAEIKAAGEKHCGTHWGQIEADLVIRKRFQADHVAYTCFGAAYIFTLLSDGFHIGLNDRRVVFSNTAKGPSGEAFEAKWVLGALLVEVIHGTLDKVQKAPPARLPPGKIPQSPTISKGELKPLPTYYIDLSIHVGSVTTVAMMVAFVSGILVLRHWSRVVSIFDHEPD